MWESRRGVSPATSSTSSGTGLTGSYPVRERAVDGTSRRSHLRFPLPDRGHFAAAVLAATPPTCRSRPQRDQSRRWDRRTECVASPPARTWCSAAAALGRPGAARESGRATPGVQAVHEDRKVPRTDHRMRIAGAPTVPGLGEETDLLRMPRERSALQGFAAAALRGRTTPAA